MRTLRYFCLVTILLSAGALAPARAVEIGQKAPDFELPSTLSGKYKLSDRVGKKHVVVQFYVLDFTPT
jgi:peroxiredoxin Q/BCP